MTHCREVWQTPDELWAAWLEAIAARRPVTAKAYADTLLEVMANGGIEPRWNPAQREVFVKWCSRDGRIGRA